MFFALFVMPFRLQSWQVLLQDAASAGNDDNSSSMCNTYSHCTECQNMNEGLLDRSYCVKAAAGKKLLADHLHHCCFSIDICLFTKMETFFKNVVYKLSVKKYIRCCYHCQYSHIICSLSLVWLPEACFAWVSFFCRRRQCLALFTAIEHLAVDLPVDLVAACSGHGNIW